MPRKINKPKEPLDSHKAVEASRHDLEHIKKRDPAVEEIVKDMVEIKRRNHFAETLGLIMFKPRGGAA